MRLKTKVLDKDSFCKAIIDSYIISTVLRTLLTARGSSVGSMSATGEKWALNTGELPPGGLFRNSVVK